MRVGNGFICRYVSTGCLAGGTASRPVGLGTEMRDFHTEINFLPSMEISMKGERRNFHHVFICFSYLLPWTC